MGSTVHDGRMERFRKSRLYVVTSQEFSRGRSTIEIVDMILAGGLRLVQLREKGLSKAELLKLAAEVRRQTLAAGALLIINDHPDVALAVGADGVHLGQGDQPVAEVRRKAPDLVIGASTHSVAEARAAQAAGASYVNIGPLFPTGTKQTTGQFIGIEGLQTISSCLTVPFTVMGGIKKSHIPALVAAGADIIAVVTAVTMADDPAREAKNLIIEIEKAIGQRLSRGSSTGGRQEHK